MMKRLAAWALLTALSALPAYGASDDISSLFTFSAGTTIQSSQVNQQFNQLISTMNAKFGRGVANTVTGANTFSGMNTFSNANTFSGNNSFTGANTFSGNNTHTARENFSQAGTTNLTTNGDLIYNSTDNLFEGYVNGGVVPIADQAGINTQTGTTYTVLTSDRNKVVTFNNASAVAVTLPQAGTTGFANFFNTQFVNLGAGAVTITPTTSTIDTAATLTLTQNQGVTLFSDNSNYITNRGKAPLPGIILLNSLTASNSTSLDFTSQIDSTYDEYEEDCNNIKPATAQTNVLLEVSEDAGSTWKTGAANYAWGVQYINVDNGAFQGADSDTSIQVLGHKTSAVLKLNNTDAAAASFKVRIFSPSSTVRHKMFQIDGVFEPQAGVATQGMTRIAGSGIYVADTSAITGIRIVMSSGNITAGQCYLYAIRKN